MDRSPSLEDWPITVALILIEVRNVHKDKMQERDIRKQTLVNAERHIYPGTATAKKRILGAGRRCDIGIESAIGTELCKRWSGKVRVLATGSSS